jgi:hypothetical protein
MFSKLFGRQPRKPEGPPPDERLVPVPIPPLVAILVALEEQKGFPLSEDEVLRARDRAVCITLPASEALAMAEKRGYNDLDPENIWSEWQTFVRSTE